jgi:hypothetical protein
MALSRAVDHPTDLHPYQFAQLMAAVLDYHPEIILELGRGGGNSTCAFTEASNQKGGSIHVISICNSPDWESSTLPRLRSLVPKRWFAPLQIEHGDIFEFDYRRALAGARRVAVFWDAHGFDVAECVLGEILPLIAPAEHLVLMHDLSDIRYQSPEQRDYGPYGLWKGDNWSGPRLRIGNVDAAVEQSIAAMDFTTRNSITLQSADHSNHVDLSDEQRAEMKAMLGDLFQTQAHWFYFTLNEHPGPYTFPHYQKPEKQPQ